METWILVAVITVGSLLLLVLSFYIKRKVTRVLLVRKQNIQGEIYEKQQEQYFKEQHDLHDW